MAPIGSARNQRFFAVRVVVVRVVVQINICEFLLVSLKNVKWPARQDLNLRPWW
jgi:hypothetical protein